MSWENGSERLGEFSPSSAQSPEAFKPAATKDPRTDFIEDMSPPGASSPSTQPGSRRGNGIGFGFKDFEGHGIRFECLEMEDRGVAFLVFFGFGSRLQYGCRLHRLAISNLLCFAMAKFNLHHISQYPMSMASGFNAGA